MAHFARVDEDNIVTDVVVVPNDQEHRGQEYLSEDIGLVGSWIQTSVNTIHGEHIQGGTPVRVNCAGIGFYYDQDLDVFIPPKPERNPSWVLNTEIYDWEPPVPIPDDDNVYVWNEDSASWVVAVIV
jgi:hypothetical protein